MAAGRAVVHGRPDANTFQNKRMYLRSRSLEVEVLPEVGGKIAQIRDLADGRLWLVPAQAPYVTLADGTNWTDYDISGMDDCFPNVDACTYPFDHGEVCFCHSSVSGCTDPGALSINLRMQ